MPIQITEEGNAIIKGLVTGKLSKEDLEAGLPEIERSIAKHGKIYVLIELLDFTGWEVEAMWERMKFDTKHFDDIERIAVVGKKKWHELLDQFSSPFSVAKTSYFQPGESEKALLWLKGGRK